MNEDIQSKTRMKKVIAFLTISLFILSNFSILTPKVSGDGENASSNPNDWVIETVDSVVDVGTHTSLAFDDQGNPGISYYDVTNLNLKYVHWNGVDWIIETVDRIGEMAPTSLAFDTLGNPAISYYDYDNCYLKCARWNGITWDIEIVDYVGSSGWTRFYSYVISLVFDPSGNPAIAYYNGNPYRDLKYAHFDGTEWHTQTVYHDGAGEGWGRCASLDFDLSGNPSIAFQCMGYIGWGLGYAHWNGLSWGIELVDGCYAAVPTSLRFDSLGNPAIAYMWQGVHAGPCELRYAYLDGTTWDIEIIDDIRREGGWPSLAFDFEGNPAISYHTGEDSRDLNYAHWNGLTWDIETVDSVGYVGGYTSLAFDSDGNPAISYYDFTNGDLKYAHKIVTVPVDTEKPSVTVNSPNGEEEWEVGTQHDITWTATDNVGVTSIDIYYSTDGGLTYPYTIATGEFNDGVYSWIIPDTLFTTCRVKVVARDAAGNYGEDVSNGNFEIYLAKFYFIHLTDTHVTYLTNYDRLKKCVDEIGQMDPKPAFVIISGDLVDWGAGISGWMNYIMLLSCFSTGPDGRLYIDDECTIPVYFCPGNHDYRYNLYHVISNPFAIDPLLTNYRVCVFDRIKPYVNVIEDGYNDYYFIYKNTIIISLNSGEDNWPNYPLIPEWVGDLLTPEGAGLRYSQIKALEEFLDGLDGRPDGKDTSNYNKIIFMHHPAILNPPPDLDGVIYYNTEKFIRICEQYGVDVVLSGHIHEEDLILDKYGNEIQIWKWSGVGTRYVITGSTGEYGYYRNVTIYNDKVLLDYCEYFRSIVTMIATSPVNLHIYDSFGNHVGMNAAGGEDFQIPNAYHAIELIGGYRREVISVDYGLDYKFVVQGTDEGTYRLTITSVANGEATTFTATDIPTSTNAIHQYTIDWDALSQGEEGVTLQIDSDGDGIFEQSINADNELTHDEFMLQTATIVDFDPDTLNLKSKGKWVTVYIELPEGYDVNQIDISSIMLNGIVPALSNPAEVSDYDNDGIPDLMVKFDRAAVIALFEGKTIPGDYVIEITGKVIGLNFKGTDMIRVIS